MGKVKERIYELAEMVEQILDSGVSDEELDEFMEMQLPPDEIEFYHAHKDVIFDMLGMGMNESLNESFEDWFEENQESDILRDEYENYLSDTEDIDPDPLSFEEFCRQKYEWSEEFEGGFDEDYEEDEDDGDDLSDYEWEVGSAVMRTLEDGDIEYDEEYVPDAIYDKTEFIKGCMKNNMEPMDCAAELLKDPEFLQEINPDSMDESMDEEYMMPALNEGRYDVSEAHPMDDLKANFRSWETEENDEEDAEELAHILQSRHPEFDVEALRKMAYDWCGLDFEVIEEDCD